MRRIALISTLLLSSLTSIACYSDRPHQYGRERPPVDQLDDRDKGLQSKDVVDASDSLIQHLAALPEINASPTQLTVVFTQMENHTSNPGFNYDIFLSRLKVNTSKYLRGRVAIIDNRDRVANIQSRELDSAPPPQGDRFGQGGAPQQPIAGGPGGIQPEYALYGKVSDLPNRGTNYYYFEFSLTNLRTRQTWSDGYEVKVAR